MYCVVIGFSKPFPYMSCTTDNVDDANKKVELLRRLGWSDVGVLTNKEYELKYSMKV